MNIRILVAAANVLFASVTFILLLIVVISGVSSSLQLRSLYWSYTYFGQNDYFPVAVQWTNYGVCAVYNYTSDLPHQSDFICEKDQFGYPYNPYHTFTYGDKLPQEMIDDKSTYSSQSKAAFYLVFVGFLLSIPTVVFAVIACISKEAWYYWGLLQVVVYGAVLTLVGGVLRKQIHSKGNKEFDKADFQAILRTKLFSILYASIALYFITAAISFFMFFTKKKFVEERLPQANQYLYQYNALYDDVNPNDALTSTEYNTNYQPIVGMNHDSENTDSLSNRPHSVVYGAEK